MNPFNPILSSTATLSFPVADDGALLCPHSGAQLNEATQAAQHAYEAAKGAGNSRETIERLRKAWVWAKACECAGVAI